MSETRFEIIVPQKKSKISLRLYIQLVTWSIFSLSIILITFLTLFVYMPIREEFQNFTSTDYLWIKNKKQELQEIKKILNNPINYNELNNFKIHSHYLSTIEIKNLETQYQKNQLSSLQSLSKDFQNNYQNQLKNSKLYTAYTICVIEFNSQQKENLEKIVKNTTDLRQGLGVQETRDIFQKNIQLLQENQSFLDQKIYDCLKIDELDIVLTNTKDFYQRLIKIFENLDKAVESEDKKEVETQINGLNKDAFSASVLNDLNYFLSLKLENIKQEIAEDSIQAEVIYREIQLNLVDNKLIYLLELDL